MTLSAISSAAVVSTSGRISSVTSSMIDFSEFSTSLCNPRWRQDSGVLRFFGPERRGLKCRGFICFCKRERTLVCKRIRRGFSWHRSTSARCATALRLCVTQRCNANTHAVVQDSLQITRFSGSCSKRRQGPRSRRSSAL